MRRLVSVVIAALVAGAAAAQPLDKAPSQYAKLGDVKVHYKTLGTGTKAVVLVHGWSSDLTFWDAQAAALGGKVRVVLIDLPGHGKSDKPEVKYTMDLFARAVDAVLADAGVEEAVLAGHSMGTPVVRQYYRLFPKKVRGLVAVDGPLRPMKIDPEVAAKFLAMIKGPDRKKAVSAFLGAMLPKVAPDLSARIKASMLNTPQHVMVSAMEGMFAADVWKEDKIEVPLLAIMAKAPHWGDDYKEHVRKLAPKADYREMDGVSHFLHMEAPKKFNAILAEFLKKQGYWADGKQGAGDDLKRLQGTWHLAAMIDGGKPVPDAALPLGPRLIVSGDTARFQLPGQPRDRDVHRVRLDPDTSPRGIDLTLIEAGVEAKGKTLRGIYELDGETLRVCLPVQPKGKKRPSGFTAPAGSQRVVMTFARPDALAKKDPADPAVVRRDLDRLQGKWVAVALERKGRKEADEVVRSASVSFDRERVTVVVGAEKTEAAFALSPGKEPSAIDLRPAALDGALVRGIYRLDGDELKLCLSPPFAVRERDRPAAFVTRADGSNNELWILRRAKQ